MSLEIRQPGDYSDADYAAMEEAKVRAAVDARITNADILRALEAVQARLDGYDEAIGKGLAIAEEIKVQVDPVVQGLMSNPMFKMLVGKAGR